MAGSVVGGTGLELDPGIVAKLQKLTACSIGRAEESAVNICLRTDHLMAADLLRAPYGRNRRSDMLSGHYAAMSCAGSEEDSSTLWSLNKCEGISIGFIRAAFFHDDQVALLEEDSANRIADLFTKALPAATFVKLRRLCDAILRAGWRQGHSESQRHGSACDPWRQVSYHGSDC